MVWFPVPLTGVTDSQSASSVTVHDIVPQPEFEILKAAVPAMAGTFSATGLTVRTGVVSGAWVTVTTKVPQLVINVMVIILELHTMLAGKLTLMVALPVPDEGEMVHQVWLLEAVQVQVVDMVKLVDPAIDATLRVVGVIENEQAAWVTLI